MKSDSIKKFIGLKNIAVIGVSRTGKGFGVAVYNHLKDRGYTVFGVNRKGGFSNNTKLYTSLFGIEHHIDGIITVVPPAETEIVVQGANDLGIQNIWMQLGSDSENAIEFCEKNKINVVHKECILMYVEPVKSIHSFHRWINKLTGKYPRMETPL
jgi:predicted CoA-binding protein